MIEATTLFEVEDRHGSGAYGKRPTALVRGEGVFVWDVTGARYLDATSGQGVAALGHCHPAVIQAITEQAGTLVSIHESFYNDRRAELLRAAGQHHASRPQPLLLVQQRRGID